MVNLEEIQRLLASADNSRIFQRVRDMAPDELAQWVKDLGKRQELVELLRRIPSARNLMYALDQIFCATESIQRWLNKPNEQLDGKTPLEVLLTGKIDLVYSAATLAAAQ